MSDECDTREELESLRATVEDMADAAGQQRAENTRRIAALEEENEALREALERERERRVRLETELNPAIEQKEYEDLETEEKVGIIRASLYDEARARRQMGDRPIAKATYKDIQTFLSGKPSTRHTYDLMEWAGDAPGYDYVTPEGRKNQNYVKVDATAVEAAPGEEIVFRRNNNPAEGGAL